MFGKKVQYFVSIVVDREGDYISSSEEFLEVLVGDGHFVTLQASHRLAVKEKMFRQQVIDNHFTLREAHKYVDSPTIVYHLKGLSLIHI